MTLNAATESFLAAHLKAEHAEIRATVQNYIDGYFGQNAALLRATFSADADLISVDEGVVSAARTAAWFDRIEAKRASGGGTLAAQAEILGIDSAGDAAIAKVRLDLPALIFTDYLALLKTKSGWKIVNKVYDGVAREAPPGPVN